jgi:hypothetical protein
MNWGSNEKIWISFLKFFLEIWIIWNKLVVFLSRYSVRKVLLIILKISCLDLSILSKFIDLQQLEIQFRKRKIILISVSIVTALHKLTSFWFIQVWNVLLKTTGRNMFLRETVKISSKNVFWLFWSEFISKV